MAGNIENTESRHATERPLVSVVINNYNYGRFIGDAIDSALNQTYSNVEVIVVDDGSTDDSREVIEGYGEKIKAVFKLNGGQASAMNRGFEAAAGELIYFLDSDDIALPDCVEKFINYYNATAENSAALQFKLQIIDGDGNLTGGITPDLERLQGGEAVRLLEQKGSYVHPPTSGNVFSRSLLEKIMPIPEKDYRICADLHLCTLAALVGTVTDIEDVLAQYRIHGANHCAISEDEKDRSPVKNYVAAMIDESSARSRQKKICADYFHRPIGGNTDLLYLIFKSTGQKLFGDYNSSGAKSLKMAKRFLSDLKRDASSVPSRNKLAAAVYLMSVALLPRPVVYKLVERLFVRPPKSFELILKKSFGR